MKNFKVIKKVLKQRCWSCNGKGCKVCNFTGQYKENYYYHIYKDKVGGLIAIDGDSLK